MANSNETLEKIDGQIAKALGSAGLMDTLTYGSVTVEGYLNEQFLEDGAGDEALIGVQTTFDCRAEDLPAIPQEEEVTINEGSAAETVYRYLRRQNAGIGRVIVVLGKVLP